MPEVSVVIPTLNNAGFIADALESTLGQSFADLEVIVVDAASTDGTREILDTIEDSRVRLFDLPANCPIALARNVGNSAATGAFIAIMDGDDIMQPSRIQKQVEFLRGHPRIDLVGSNFLAIGENLRLPRRQPLRDARIKARLLYANGNALHNPTVMIRHAHLLDNNLHYPMRRMDEDHALWLACMKAGASFANIPEDLLHYRKHDGSYTARKGQEYRNDKVDLRAEILMAFFGTLTRAEARAIGHLLAHRNLNSPGDLAMADSAFGKIRQAEGCEYGADLKTVRGILAKASTWVDRRLARARHRRQPRPGPG